MNTPVFGRSPGFPSSVHPAPPEISAYDAARLMAWRKIGVVVVVRDHQPIGIVTDRDLTTRVLGNGLDARSIRIGRVMTTPLVTIENNESDEHILQRLVRSGVRQIPLVDESGHLIGLAALEQSGDARGGQAVARSTVLVPMVKRKRWSRLVFRFKQNVAPNFRWIGATVALAAIGGVVSLLVGGHWNPWAPSNPLSTSRAAPAHTAEIERSADSTKPHFNEPHHSQPAATK